MKVYIDKIKKMNNDAQKLELTINENIINEISGDIDFKLDYITMILNSGYSRRTVEQSITIFKNVKQFEKIFEKDVYNFDLSQTLILLKSFKKPSITSLAAEKSLLDKYLLFSFENNKVNLATHPSFNIKMRDMEELVNSKSRKNKYITYTEYLQLLNNCINEQDKAFIIMVWNGMLNKNLDIIRSLKGNHLHQENNTIVIDDYIDIETAELKTIVFKFEDFEMKILERAMILSKYTNLTNMGESDLNMDNPYYFKSINSGKKIYENTLRVRFAKVTAFEKKSDIKLKSLSISGIYNRIRKLNLSNIDYIREMVKHGVARSTADDVKRVINSKEN